MLRLSTKAHSLDDVPIQTYCQYTTQMKSRLIPKISLDHELLRIQPDVPKFSFQKYFKGFDAVQFGENYIHLFDSQSLAITHSFAITQIAQVKIHLKKNDEEDEKSTYTLSLSLLETTGKVFTIFLSDILPPYCEGLSEIMTEILTICTTTYDIPVLLGIPYAY